MYRIQNKYEIFKKWKTNLEKQAGQAIIKKKKQPDLKKHQEDILE